VPGAHRHLGGGGVLDRPWAGGVTATVQLRECMSLLIQHHPAGTLTFGGRRSDLSFCSVQPSRGHLFRPHGISRFIPGLQQGAFLSFVGAYNQWLQMVSALSSDRYKVTPLTEASCRANARFR
jgi:hypothetical protein